MPNKRESAAGGKLRVTRILMPTDFSAGAEPALAWAMGLAEVFGAGITVLHVLDPTLGAMSGLPGDFGVMSAYGEILEIVRREARSEMAKIEKRYSAAETVIREGSPRAGILDAAAELGANLIVMGTHGRTGFAHVLFGSVAEHVVRHSRIPVLTVRQQPQ